MTFRFNPSIFKSNNELFLLVREETDIINWGWSTCSYSIHKLDAQFKIIDTSPCTFIVKNNAYKQLRRNDINDVAYVFEDIRVYPHAMHGKTIGITTLVVKQVEPRIFRVGVVEIDPLNKTIQLQNILEIPNMANIEKNWTLFDHAGKYYFIYSLFPKLIIYNYDETTSVLSLHSSKETMYLIEHLPLLYNRALQYRDVCLTACSFPIKINKNMYLLFCKNRKYNDRYKYYNCVLFVENGKFQIAVINNVLEEGYKLYLNDIKTVDSQLVGCYGLEDSSYKVCNKKIKVNVIIKPNIYNFISDIKKFIVENLISNTKYDVVYNARENGLTLILSSLYTDDIAENSFIYGTGMLRNPLSKQINAVGCCLRGPYTKEILGNESTTDNVYGEASLLISVFYKPNIKTSLNEKIGILPSIANFEYYTKYKTDYHIISPYQDWKTIIDELCSCKAILSSLLHGLIYADSYNIPNIWLDEMKEGEDFAIHDYLLGRNREIIRITNLSEFRLDKLNYKNVTIDFEKLQSMFPFQ